MGKRNKEPQKDLPIVKLASPKIVLTQPDATSDQTIPFVDDDEEDRGLCAGNAEDDAYLEAAQRQRNLRKNSISLPALQNLDLQVLQQQMGYAQPIPEHHQSSGTAFSDGEGQTDDTNDDDEASKVTLRNANRKPYSAPPLKKSRKSDCEFTMDELNEDYSPVNSITSINSLASLLREKIQGIPTKIRKKPQDYKIKAFVGFLFLCIIFLVGFAYIMYHQQVLAKAYFKSIKFNKAKRAIRIFNKEDVEIMHGRLAMHIDSSKAYPCLDDHQRKDGSICLEWLDGARLYLNEAPMDANTSCYSIQWKALTEDTSPTDCYDLYSNQGHWYGGGQSANSSWPLEIGSHDFHPLITGDIKKHQWGNVVKRYFINSRGTAIIVDNDTPLYVSIHHKNNTQICIQARHDNFAYVNHIRPLPELNYTICTASNMKTLHSSLSQHSLWDGLKPEDIATLHSLISEPVWHIAPRVKQELNEATIYNYTEDVIALGFLKQGHVLINEFWQDQIGDLTLDKSRFETLDQTVNIIHRRGFKIVFTIQPFISTESSNFADCVDKNLLISERFSDRIVPALTRYKSLSSAGVLDITNQDAVPWLQDKLKQIKDDYQIDSFYLDLGTAYNMPHYYQCNIRLKNPDEYKTYFTKTFEKVISVIGVSSAVSLPRPPIFVSLPPFESSWEAIKLVIPTILSYGVIGYPFLMPGAVGGDIDWPGSEQFIPTYPKSEQAASNTTVQDNGIMLPEKELYLRWLQLATFLPVMKFTHLPSKYNDQQVLDMAKFLTMLRQKTVAPLLLKSTQEALDEGLPLIRPLWMLSPNDPACHTVSDEFSVGEGLIVAPILDKGIVHREVYLPAGVWKDGIEGSLRKGSRWLHDYRVPTDKVAYFVKMPDNTRF